MDNEITNNPVDDDFGNLNDIVVLWMKKALNAIKAAKYNLEIQNDIDTAANRAYYANYGIMNAMCAFIHERYSTHKKLMIDFNNNYIKTNILNREKQYMKRLSECQRLRHTGDYSVDYIISKEDVARQISLAEELYSECRDYLHEKNVIVDSIDSINLKKNQIEEENAIKIIQSMYNDGILTRKKAEKALKSVGIKNYKLQDPLS